MSELKSEKVSEPFTIKRWETWYLYSFYLNAEVDDLEEAARRLVSSGLARCFVLPDGRLGWGAKDLTPPVERDNFRSNSRTLPGSAYCARLRYVPNRAAISASPIRLKSSGTEISPARKPSR